MTQNDILDKTWHFLNNRNINNAKELKELINTKTIKYTNELKLANINKFIKVLDDSFENNYEIVLQGDYDVDGMTSTTLFNNFLNDINYKQVHIGVPDRRNGYGVNNNMINQMIAHYRLRKKNATFIFMDHGITEIDQAEYLNNLAKRNRVKYNLIIIDHHEPPIDEIRKRFDNCDVTIINPQDKNNKNLLPVEISAAAVVYKSLLAYSQLSNIYKNKFNMAKYLYLVGLSTVADSMDVKGENRKFINEFINYVNNHSDQKWNAFMSQNYIDKIDEKTIGWNIAPVLNAASRMEGTCNKSLQYLNNSKFNQELFNNLIDLNEERKQIVNAIFDSIKNNINDENKYILNIVLNYKKMNLPVGQSLNGIIGLIANKVLQEKHKPVIIFTKGNNGYYGSARAPEFYHLDLMFNKLDNLLISHGGHGQAAGVSVKKQYFEEFNKQSQIIMKKQYQNIVNNNLIRNKYDFEIQEYSPELENTLNSLKPFGQGFEEPIWHLHDKISNLNISLYSSNQNHLKIESIKPELAGFKIIKWNAINDYQKLQSLNGDDQLDITAHVDHWNGITQFIIDNMQIIIKK